MKPISKAIVIAVMAGAATAAGAASSAASITDLTITLVDLDPNDGITPWFSFTTGPFVNTNSSGASSLNLDTGGTDHDNRIEFGSFYTDTAASTGTTGVTSSASTSAAGVFAQGQTSAKRSFYVASAMRSTEDYQVVEEVVQLDTVLLSPKTALTFSGLASTSAAAELECAGCIGTMSAGVQLIGSGFVGDFSRQLEVTYVGPTILTWDDRVVAGFRSNARVVVTANCASPTASDADSAFLSATISNPFAEQATVGFVANAGVTGSRNVISIPEPATWALMLLGGAVVGVMRARRRS